MKTFLPLALLLSAGPLAADCPPDAPLSADIYVLHEDGDYTRYRPAGEGIVSALIFDLESGASPAERLLAGGVFEVLWSEEGVPDARTRYRTALSELLPLVPETEFEVEAVVTYESETPDDPKDVVTVEEALRLTTGASGTLEIGACTYAAFPFTVTFLRNGEDEHAYHGSYLPGIGIEIYRGFSEFRGDLGRVDVETLSISLSAPAGWSGAR
ncbi:hypothetical protein [Pontivivens ytuae]|uniref:Lipid/polyisoprenoid-binding YceI-like domain-containing protein n=1 Tax=Pontivivens ytuae TaxID=2789856 RepID=A0A7S9LR85_9RHOB|nr:hypothetical protein [Pontivivens ytuae]QPH53742.1 hypothetical protein I0K15_18495 [Pontivivens ytuae]